MPTSGLLSNCPANHAQKLPAGNLAYRRRDATALVVVSHDERFERYRWCLTSVVDGPNLAFIYGCARCADAPLDE